LMSVCCECCQVEVSETSRSLVQRSPTDCGVSECDLETLWMRRPWKASGRRDKEKKPQCFLFIAVLSSYLLLCTGPNPTRIAIYTTECTYRVVQIWPGLMSPDLHTNQSRSYLNHFIYSTTPTEESKLDSSIISLCINILFNRKECCNHRITTEISNASLTAYNSNFTWSNCKGF